MVVKLPGAAAVLSKGSPSVFPADIVGTKSTMQKMTEHHPKNAILIVYDTILSDAISNGERKLSLVDCFTTCNENENRCCNDVRLRIKEILLSCLANFESGIVGNGKLTEMEKVTFNEALQLHIN